MKYHLWISGNSVGRHDELDVRQLIESGAIRPSTLTRQEGSDGAWKQISGVVNLIKRSNVAESSSTPKISETARLTQREISRSLVADALMIVAGLHLLAAPIIGFAVNQKTNDEVLSVVLAVAGMGAGLILL